MVKNKRCKKKPRIIFEVFVVLKVISDANSQSSKTCRCSSFRFRMAGTFVVDVYGKSSWNGSGE